MHGANRYSGDGHARKYVSPDLEDTHWHGTLEDSLGRTTKGREADEGAHEEQAVSSDEGELDEGKGDRIAELQHDDLARI